MNYYVIEYSQWGDDYRIVNQKPFETLEEAENLQRQCYVNRPEGRFVIKSDEDE